jgi:hypothetical protein
VGEKCRVCAGKLVQALTARKRCFCSKACARKDERRREKRVIAPSQDVPEETPRTPRLFRPKKPALVQAPRELTHAEKVTILGREPYAGDWDG